MEWLSLISVRQPVIDFHGPQIDYLLKEMSIISCRVYQVDFQAQVTFSGNLGELTKIWLRSGSVVLADFFGKNTSVQGSS